MGAHLEGRTARSKRASACWGHLRRRGRRRCDGAPGVLLPHGTVRTTQSQASEASWQGGRHGRDVGGQRRRPSL